MSCLVDFAITAHVHAKLRKPTIALPRLWLSGAMASTRRMKFLAAFTLAFATAIAAPATGPLRVLASNPRYFTDDSGKAIFLTGSHTWANFAIDSGEADPPAGIDYGAFLDFLVAHNHNFFRGWLWEVPFTIQGDNGGPFHYQPFPWQRPGPGLATDGKPRFSRASTKRISTASTSAP
jgi:hypothetical protein